MDSYLEETKYFIFGPRGSMNNPNCNLWFTYPQYTYLGFNCGREISVMTFVVASMDHRDNHR